MESNLTLEQLRARIEKAKKLRGNLARYDYRNCKCISFQRLSEVIWEALDAMREIEKANRKFPIKKHEPKPIVVRVFFVGDPSEY